MTTQATGHYSGLHGFTRFKADYNAGKANGLRHRELSPTFQAENARKCAEGREDKTAPRVMAYWLGYYDGMEIIGSTPAP